MRSLAAVLGALIALGGALRPSYSAVVRLGKVTGGETFGNTSTPVTSGRSFTYDDAFSLNSSTDFTINYLYSQRCPFHHRS